MQIFVKTLHRQGTESSLGWRSLRQSLRLARQVFVSHDKSPPRTTDPPRRLAKQHRRPPPSPAEDPTRARRADLLPHRWRIRGRAASSLADSGDEDMRVGLGLLWTSASTTGYIVLVVLPNFVTFPIAFHTVLTAGVAAPNFGLQLRGLEAGVGGAGAPRAGSALALAEIRERRSPSPSIPFFPCCTGHGGSASAQRMVRGAAVTSSDGLRQQMCSQHGRPSLPPSVPAIATLPVRQA
jgi:hypothetical protein